MGGHVYFMACLALLIGTGCCLRCYVCDSNSSDGCIKAERLKNYTCGSAASGFKQVCAYIVKYDTDNHSYKAHSGCELVSEKDTLAKSEEKLCKSTATVDVQVKECRICDVDVCNSADYNSLNTFFYIPIIYLLAKCTLPYYKY